jgi:hypothetical protein
VGPRRACRRGPSRRSPPFRHAAAGEAAYRSVHLGEPRKGNLFRLFVVAQGFGVLIKLPGNVQPDLQTGKLVATFDDNP